MYSAAETISRLGFNVECLAGTPNIDKIPEEVQDRKDSGTTEINTTFKSLAKEYVGASTYNKVKRALSEGGEAKTKYDGMLNKLKEDNGG
jgi:hypothetical protein